MRNLVSELEEVISLTESAIAELRPVSAATQSLASEAPSPVPVKEKWSKENHPAYQAGYRPKAPVAATAPTPQSPTVEEARPHAPTSFSVNDVVLAKWLSGDKAYYPARITSITGSKAKPVYIVTFKSYATTETLSAYDIKPIGDSKKRKAEGELALGSTNGVGTPMQQSHSGVISAAASIDPDLASQAKREPSKVSDGPTRPAKVPRKVKANKELEAGKTKWQEFSMKGVKKGPAAKKESMFRTPEGVNARGEQYRIPPRYLLLTISLVGFTGSGREMRKDPTRSRHIYQPGADDDVF